MTHFYAAHNKITGSIPETMQNKSFFDLDLSYNKITGTYDQRKHPDIAKSRLVLEVNRLSGWFPTTTMSKNNSGVELNALRGNLFSCRYVPEEDVYSEDFSCGSESLELSLYTFLIALVLGLLLFAFMVFFPSTVKLPPLVTKILYLFRHRRLYTSFLLTLDDIYTKKKVREISIFVGELRISEKLFVSLFIVNIITCLPLYGVKLFEYGTEDTRYTTHSYLYQWTWSISFVKGMVPTLLLIFMWQSVIFCLIIMTRKKKYLNPNPQLPFGRTAATTKILQKRTTISIFLFNALVTCAVNGVYIYFSNRALSPNMQTAIQIAVAFFKVGWNMVAVPLFVKLLRQSATWVGVEVVILVFNNILIPCIVTAFTSPACFQVIGTFYDLPFV